MRRYLLDTCTLIWMLKDYPRIKGVKEEIDCYQGDYAISVGSIKEFVYLIQSGKIKTDISFDELVTALDDKHILICKYDRGTLKVLSELPFFKKHQDPSDRVIIANAIADNRILISGDHNFTLYKDLNLMMV